MDTNGLYDIYDAWHVPFWQQTWFKALAFASVGALIMLVIGALWRKYRLRKPARPAWEAALAELAMLKDAKEIEGKEFYCALTGTVKKYFHRRYGFDVLGATDDELLVFLADQAEVQHILDDMRAICVGCITIKFAHAAAGQEQMKHDLARACTIIEKTRPSQRA